MWFVRVSRIACAALPRREIRRKDDDVDMHDQVLSCDRFWMARCLFTPGAFARISKYFDGLS